MCSKADVADNVDITEGQKAASFGKLYDTIKTVFESDKDRPAPPSNETTTRGGGSGKEPPPSPPPNQEITKGDGK
jgi:hypothetical protein